MPSTLDRRIDAITDALCGPAGPMATGVFEQHGIAYPIIATAPPSLIPYFAHFCAEHADKTFLVAGDERLTFAQTHDAAIRVAAALVSGFGVKPGDRIAIAARNAPAWVVLYMATLMAGGVATLLNGWWQGNELCEGIGDTGAKLVFADPARAKRMADCAPTGAELFVIDMALPLKEAIAPVLARGSVDATLPYISGDNGATILFTSGSTGQSKGALSTHRAIIQGIFNFLVSAMTLLQIQNEDGTATTLQHATLLSIPLFHVTGEVPVFLQSFAMGRKLVMMPKWDAGEALRLIEKEQITYFVGVPLMSFEIMNHPDRDKYDLSTCTSYAAGGAPRPEEHVRRLEAEMNGAHPLLGYGLTETNAVGCGNINENYLAKPSSTGRAAKPLVEIAILDDAGLPVGGGARGEVCLRSICNFAGYWNNAAATAAAITPDGFFRSGDIGYLDEDGYLFIVDRKKDIIIRGGENISCQEVEAAIYEHPAVGEAAVFGLADERLGEIVGAVVHFQDRQNVSDEVLKLFLCERLAAFKVPERIWIATDLLPKLGTEKIDKLSLRRRFGEIHAAEKLSAA